MRTGWFVRPYFRIAVDYCSQPRQAGFCPYTQRRISDPPEPTFGGPCFLIKGVAPHPNCPPIAVLPNGSERYDTERAVFHRRLHPGWRPDFDGSRLPYTFSVIPQPQAAVKLHRDFAFRWGRLDRSPLHRFHGTQPGDSGTLVGPSCKPPIKRLGITLP